LDEPIASLTEHKGWAKLDASVVLPKPWQSPPNGYWVVLRTPSPGTLEVRLKAKTALDQGGDHFVSACSGTYVKTDSDCSADRIEFNVDYPSPACSSGAAR
jgi:hypothetical protein